MNRLFGAGENKEVEPPRDERPSPATQAVTELIWFKFGGTLGVSGKGLRRFFSKVDEEEIKGRFAAAWNGEQNVTDDNGKPINLLRRVIVDAGGDPDSVRGESNMWVCVVDVKGKEAKRALCVVKGGVIEVDEVPC